jgi:type IV secretion system protein VirB9
VRTPAPVAAFNYNYTYSGPDQLAPVKVFDDGNSTYIKYRALPVPAPSVTARDAKGNERPITSFSKDHQMIVDEVAAELVLRHGSGTIVIYNETLNPR